MRWTRLVAIALISVGIGLATECVGIVLFIFGICLLFNASYSKKL